MRKRLTPTAAVVVLACAGCADDGPPATAPVPSQIVPPGGVPPCDVDELEFVASAEMIIGIRNAGPVECEVDVSKSPNRDPLMEPSVWLRPGSDAELAVAMDDTQCEQPATVTSVDLVVNGEPIAAPVLPPPTCSATLTAIYTAD